MKDALVVGMNKTGTTIVASVIQKSIPGAIFYVEARSLEFFEKCGEDPAPHVVKVIYEHWMHRPFLLTGIVRAETGFRPDKTIAIVRDPRDALISALMYSAYEHVLQGASEEQVSQWVKIVRDKEENPQKYAVIDLIGNFSRIFNCGYAPNSFFETFNSYCAWIAGNRDYLYVLRYEDFVGGNTAGLTGYLGTKLPRSREVDPVLQRVTRTKSAENWRTMMLAQDVAYWRERYSDALEPFGYTDWEVNPERSDPAAGSEYILRITQEAFDSIRPKPAESASKPAESAFHSWSYNAVLNPRR